MTETHLVEKIRHLAAPLAAGLGLGIWGIELAFGGRSLVRVFVEKEGAGAEPDTPAPDPAQDLLQGQGVSINECAELSRLLGLSLDVEDVIPGAYVLEISSPGLDRIFFSQAQLAGAVGKVVELTLHNPLAAVPGRRKFRGLLTGVSEPEDGSPVFTLMADETPRPGEETALSFVFADLKKVRQVHVVQEKPLPGKAKAKKAEGAGRKKARPDAAEEK